MIIDNYTRAARGLRRLASAVALGIICVSAASAGPANPAPIVLRQPDGTQFVARAVGDEWANGHETLDGYGILNDRSDGYWKYADQGADGTLVLTQYVVTRDEPIGLQRGLRAQRPPGVEANGSSLPVDGAAVGSRATLVILAQFSNKAGTTTAASWQSAFFGATNSVKHHYLVSSYNQMTLTSAAEAHGTANDGVVGWVTVSSTHPNTAGTTGAANQQLTKDAINAADPYVNFAAYDTNGDNSISPSELMIVVIVAGNETAFGGATSSCSPSVWGHVWSIFSVAPPIVDGRSVGGSGYAQFGEMHCRTSSPPGLQATIGIMAHEVGHLFGLPDLYDTDGSSEGIGNWSLMAAGSWNGVTRSGDSPALQDPWGKFRLGWITPTLVTGTLTNQTIPASATSSTVYQFLAGSAVTGTGEYFLVENRQQTSYDAAVPGAGLLIWHIDESRSSNRDECIPGGSPACSSAIHYKVALVQADNAFNLELHNNRGDSGDPFPGSTSNTSWTGATAPNSNMWAGGASNVRVTSISGPSMSMTATLSLGVAAAPTVTTGAASLITPTTATLNGTVNPNGATTTGQYQYGLTTGYGSTTPSQALGSGSATVALGGGAITGLTCNTQYHFRAIATNATGPSTGLNATFTTAACLPPTAFNKTAPANGATNQSPAPLLSWGTSTTATAYQYCVDTSNNNVCDTTWVPAGTATTAALGNLAASTTYYWQVRATNAGGSTDANAGAWWSFTTQAFRAARLTQPSPSVRLPGQIVPFAWDAGVNVVQYSLFVGSSPGGGDIYAENQSGLSRFVTNLPVDGRLVYVRLYSRIANVWIYEDTTFLTAQSSSSSFDFGIVPVRGDFDGDGVADLATWWGASGIWQIQRSSNGYVVTQEISWGRADQGDRPVMGDFDGDGKADPAVWRAGSGLWLALLSSTNYAQYLQLAWGRADLGDVPVPADFDGDGKTDPAVWRRDTGHWYALRSATNYGQYIDVQWGREALSDRPVPGDYDGDNKADPAVWRAVTGEWLILRSSSNYANYIGVSWGRENESDQPEPADYDGDGRMDIAVWRRATGFWYMLKSSTNFMGQAAAQLGNLALGDRPVQGRFLGADPKVDPAVWRGSTGTWMISTSPASPPAPVPPQ